ncbi:hypothetical protein VKT23_001963 [Stygiomarasmius scandens]|uniref:Protein kinase domain-containing protein n=1 Tax=Marasmiellus scandens TaxID=2682957 RepID=A0ABR1K5Z9_9AGAR
MPRRGPADTDLMPSRSGFLLGNRFKLLEVLGSGAYGRVHKAVDLCAPPHGPRFFAVKCLLRPPSTSRRAQFQLREFTLHKLVSEHPNIVTFHKVYQDNDFVYVVLDLCTGGDLFAAITPGHVFFRNDVLVKSTFLQILDAVHYCHQRSVFHRDLKPENILCSQDRSSVFLADFGLSTEAKISNEFRCGSAYYMSPECVGEEVILNSYSTRQNDIWSLGVILTNMITGRNPWRLAASDDPCFSEFLNNRDFLRSVLPISKETNDILKQIFQLNPSRRISIPELKRAVSIVQSFFMTDEELRVASDAARQVAEDFGIVLSPQLCTVPEAEDSSSNTTTSFKTGSEEVYIYHGPPRESQLPRNRDQSALFDVVASSSSSSSDTTTSSSDSQGPITPETRPIEPLVDVPDLQEEIVGIPVIVFHPASPKVNDAVQHRAPSSTAVKPPPRRVGRQLLKSAVRRLKRLSGSVSSSSS